MVMQDGDEAAVAAHGRDRVYRITHMDSKRKTAAITELALTGLTASCKHLQVVELIQQFKLHKKAVQSVLDVADNDPCNHNTIVEAIARGKLFTALRDLALKHNSAALAMYQDPHGVRAERDIKKICLAPLTTFVKEVTGPESDTTNHALVVSVRVEEHGFRYLLQPTFAVPSEKDRVPRKPFVETFWVVAESKDGDKVNLDIGVETHSGLRLTCARSDARLQNRGHEGVNHTERSFFNPGNALPNSLMNSKDCLKIVFI